MMAYNCQQWLMMAESEQLTRASCLFKFNFCFTHVRMNEYNLRSPGQPNKVSSSTAWNKRRSASASLKNTSFYVTSIMKSIEHFGKFSEWTF